MNKEAGVEDCFACLYHHVLDLMFYIVGYRFLWFQENTFISYFRYYPINRSIQVYQISLALSSPVLQSNLTRDPRPNTSSYILPP